MWSISAVPLSTWGLFHAAVPSVATEQAVLESALANARQVLVVATPAVRLGERDCTLVLGFAGAASGMTELGHGLGASWNDLACSLVVRAADLAPPQID